MLNLDREKDYEARFVSMCVREGWLCEKFISPGKRGVPDRIVTAFNYICFVEMKTPVGRLSKLQIIDHKRRRDRGADVYVVSNHQEALETVARIKKKSKENTYGSSGQKQASY